ncbi:serine protease [Aspergillus brunneoviolaceus CBS 621.78]|uniref:Trypsin-like serine protease n=1 Tax=Aspergillus brunneoviolaceus CBS 621.78 TaxID=1450534 RepID=A0ACD1FW97_9EURO|nr:trypsin-like serine protease [Aspergillus brunneoviolaceus CBS 621.78]RAH41260.1 trypsin-like serine protease [Aspergillus brunneoviolaceus CBS 621.78]
MRATVLLSLVPFIQGVLCATDVSGGSPATINDLPYLVSILRSGSPTCGGVLIASNRVLTSAQCVYGAEASPSSFSVRTGSSQTLSGGSAFTVSRIARHSQFNPTTYDYDVAEPAVETECVASGWGGLERQLQSVTLPIVDRDICDQAYGGRITDRMICAGGEAGKGTCPGDRGGPLTCGGQLAGIISQTNGCDLLGLPDVFTDVANAGIQAWIKSQ